MKRTFTYKLNIFLFLLPALILFVGILIAPIIMSAYYSFHEFKYHEPGNIVDGVFWVCGTAERIGG